MKPLKLLFSLVALFVGSSIMGAPLADAFDISHRAGTGIMAGLSLAASPFLSGQGGLNAATLTITDVVTEFGDYYKNGGQNESNILQQMKEKRQLDAVSQKRIIDGDILELSQAEISGIIQSFKTNWSPGNAATFTANPIRTRNIKIDLELYPDNIKSAWLGFLANIAEGDRANWPFVRWYWEKLVGPQWGKDLSLVDWAGNYVAPTNDTTTGPTKGSYDGLRHQIIADAALGGSAKMVDMALSGNLATAASAFDVVEDAAASIPQHWLDEDILFIMSAKSELNYFRDRRNTHGQNYGQDNMKSRSMTVDGRPNWRIVPLTGMDQESDHDWLVVTPASNLLNVRRGAGYNLKMESARRCVSVMADWHEGFGFGIKEMVYYHSQYMSS
jgi:hypothetical protein